MLLESLDNPYQNPQESLQNPERTLSETTAYSKAILKTLREPFANSDDIHHESWMMRMEPQQITSTNPQRS